MLVECTQWIFKKENIKLEIIIFYKYSNIQKCESKSINWMRLVKVLGCIHV